MVTRASTLTEIAHAVLGNVVKYLSQLQPIANTTLGRKAYTAVLAAACGLPLECHENEKQLVPYVSGNVLADGLGVSRHAVQQAKFINSAGGLFMDGRATRSD